MKKSDAHRGKSKPLTIILNFVTRDSRLDEAPLVDCLEKEFGGRVSIAQQNGAAVISWSATNATKILDAAQSGRLNTLINQTTHRTIWEILVNEVCCYHHEPVLPQTRNPVNVLKNELENAMEKVDIVLMTTADIESETVRKTLSPWPGKSHTLRGNIGTYTYELGQFGRYRVAHVASAKGSIGEGAATMTVLKAIQVANPKAIILIGIACGLQRREQCLGDIIIAESVYPYEPQRISANGYIHRGKEIACGQILLGRFANYSPDWNLPAGRRLAKVHRGLMLSGEKLVADAKLRDTFSKQFPTALGVEMEGAGAYPAARGDYVEIIMVKAISDWGDEHKNDAAQPFAAYAATSLAKHVMSQRDLLTELGAQELNLPLPIDPEHTPEVQIDNTQTNASGIGLESTDGVTQTPAEDITYSMPNTQQTSQPGLPPLSQAEQAVFRALLQLAFSKDREFAAGFVEYEMPSQLPDLIRRIKDAAPEDGSHIPVAIDLSTTPGQQAVATRLIYDMQQKVREELSHATPDLLILTGLATRCYRSNSLYPVLDEKQAHEILDALNKGREELQRQYPCPILFCLPTDIMELLPLEAPDLFNWRRGYYFFPSNADKRMEDIRTLVEALRGVAPLSAEWEDALYHWANADLSQRGIPKFTLLQDLICDAEVLLRTAGKRAQHIRWIARLYEILGYMYKEEGAVDRANYAFEKSSIWLGFHT